MTIRRASIRRRAIVAGILATIIGVAVLPQRARAIPVEDFPLLSWEIEVFMSELSDRGLKEVEGLALDSVSFQLQLALIDAFNFIGNRFAYETAVWFASGGNAQSELFDRRSTGQFVEDTFLGAGFEFIDRLDRFTSGFLESATEGGPIAFKGTFGIVNFICQPSAPEVSLAIKLGLENQLRPVKPKCSTKDIIERWDTFLEETTGNPAKALEGIGVTFERGETDLAAALDLHTSLTEFSLRKTTDEFQAITSNDWFRNVSSLISDNTKTPAAIVQDKVQRDVVAKPAEQQVEAAKKLIDAVGSWEEFDAFFGNAALALGKNFVLTLAAQAFQKQLIENGLFGGESLNLGRFFDRPGSADTDAAPLSNRAAVARQVYAELQRPWYSAPGNLDLLSRFTSCPNTSVRQPDTCVMDEALARAARERRTVQEMLPEIGSRAFVAAGTSGDQKPECYRTQLCASNLARMRLARVIPVGWELAAETLGSSGEVPILDTVVGGFHADGGDGVCDGNARSGHDVESPFCGLIDPNWVFQYPEHLCRLEAPTTTLLDSGSSLRATACVDAPSCVTPKADGTGCEEYGYCVRERRTWQLGTASCPSYAASCRALRSRTGEELALLANTVDYGSCNAGNAGCAWYATDWIRGTDWNDAPTPGTRRYFNHSVEQCMEEDEGCTVLVPMEATVGSNFIANASFDQGVDANGIPIGWLGAPHYPVNAELVDGEGNSKVLRMKSGSSESAKQQFVNHPLFVPGVTLTASTRFRAPVGVPGQIHLGAQWGGAQGGRVTRVNGNGVWQIISATITVTTAVLGLEDTNASNDNTLQVDIYGTDSTNWVEYDWVKLEIGPSATSFHDGYATDIRVRLRIPPDDFNCSDSNPANDHSSCASFAQACTAADVGCEQYTPVIRGAAVPGTIAPIDRCPAECVGYAMYREVPSAFDGSTSFDAFIPTEGRVRMCALEDEGCASFTNLDAAAAGGERRESFTSLRRCRKPTETGASPATYYTWEGSEEEGYQIRQFQLQSSVDGNPNSPPTVLDVSRGSENCGPNVAADTVDAAGSNHYGQSPVVPVDTNGDGVMDALGTNSLYDSGITPDCRAFYTQNGTIFYRRLSKSVLIEDACTTYRADHALTNNLCEAKDGEVTTQGCVFRGLAAASTRCTAAAVGCRAYRGSASGAVATVLASDFSLDTAGWSVGTRSNESVRVTAGSLRLDAGATSVHSLDAGATGVLQLPVPGGTYEVLLVGKGAGKLTVDIVDASNTTLVSSTPSGAQEVTLGANWQQVSFGPLLLKHSATAGAKLSLKNNATLASMFVDELVLREVPELVTAIKGSWTIPRSCEMASVQPGAAPEAQGMLGCRAYTDRAGKPHTLRSFSRLCSDSVVGCTAFMDTHNSTAVDTRDVHGGASALDGVTVAADTLVYYVDEAPKRCTEAVKGCRRFGQPTINRGGAASAGVVEAWNDVWLRDDPDRYEGAHAILCTDEALFCEEFQGTDGSLYEFKHPGKRTCEWRDSPPAGASHKGWFRFGTADPCDPTVRGIFDAAIGTVYGIRTNADPAYDGRAGACSVAQDRCVELRDPADTSFINPTVGKAYAANRTLLELAACTGASRKAGCVLVEETGNPARTWSSLATYAESETQGDAQITPINCDTHPAACLRCVQGSHCVQPDGAAGIASCVRDADCRTGTGSHPYDVCVDGNRVGDRCDAGPCDAGFACTQLVNDANLLVHVQPTRQCSQWYARNGETVGFDERSGLSVSISNGVKLLGAGGALARPAPSYLTKRTYQERDRSWYGEEYVGYAIPGRAGLEFHEQLDDDGVPKLLPTYCPANYAEGSTALCGPVDGTCLSDAPGTAAVEGRDESACGPLLAGSGARGTCMDGYCTYPSIVHDVVGGVAAVPDTAAIAAQSCKAYPEQDAPFPRSVAYGVLAASWSPVSGDVPVPNTNFERVRLCDDLGDRSGDAAGGTACECSYRKATYGNSAQPRYYGSTTEAYPRAICVGGAYDGRECEPDATGPRCGVEGLGACGATGGKSCRAGDEPGDRDGSCSVLKRLDPALGVPGFCLEEDRARPVYGHDDLFACRTFLPVDQLEGAPDLNYQMTTAGYQPAQPQYMCLQAKGNAILPSARDEGTQQDADGNTIPLAPYPDDSAYWVALRVESLYTDAGNDDAKTLFSNDRSTARRVVFPSGVEYDKAAGYEEGVTSGLEEHPIFGTQIASVRTEMLVHTSYELYDDERFGASDAVLDRRAGNRREKTYWDLRIRDGGLYTWEIEEIMLIPTRSFTDDGNQQRLFSVPADGFSLDAVHLWAACVYGDRTVKRGTDSNASRCWNSVALSGVSGHHFSVPADVLASTSDGCTELVPPGSETGAQTRHTYTGDMFLGVQAVVDTAQQKITGLRVGFCHDVDDVGGADSNKPFDIYVKFREMCTDVAQVYDGATRRGKPWTDRLWQSRAVPYTVSGLGYSMETKNPKFGAAGSSVPPAAGAWYVDGDVVGGEPGAFSGTFAGAPYGCSTGGYCPPHATYPGQSALTDAAVGLQKVQEVFAHAMSRWQWNGTQWNSSGTPSDVAGQATVPTGSTEALDVPSAPVVRSVGENDVEGTAGTFTVEGQSSGRVNGSGGRLEADIAFYFEANPNQMPVRSIHIEAGDGVARYNAGGVNSYPNHRPDGVCKPPPNDETPYDERPQNFGESTEACVDRPFNFTARYDCPSGSQLALPLCNGAANPAVAWNTAWDTNGCWDGSTQACVFRPRVQVKDNWGYCTGTCGNAASNGGTKCYDPTPTDDTDVSECHTTFPNATNPSWNPWVAFDGRVVVAPP